MSVNERTSSFLVEHVSVSCFAAIYSSTSTIFLTGPLEADNHLCIPLQGVRSAIAVTFLIDLITIDIVAHIIPSLVRIRNIVIFLLFPALIVLPKKLSWKCET